MIDLRSDTVTLPNDAMRNVMRDALVGDDVYGEDPTVNELEQYAADLLGKSAALFVPSGTQSNLLALLTHCGRGDEYIVGDVAHTYRFEGGGAAALGGIQPQPVPMQPSGELALEDIRGCIKPDDFHFARTKLICLENTHSGAPLSFSYIQDVAQLAKQNQLDLHLDGARFFNAAIATQMAPADLAEPFESVSICLSKGLGAPVGSILVGSEEFIGQARRWRKMVGGGMRQAGIIAAGGLFALSNNVERLADDHRHAQLVAQALGQKFGFEQVEFATNMVHLGIGGTQYKSLSAHLESVGIRVGRPRWVFHLNVGDEDVDKLCDAITRFKE